MKHNYLACSIIYIGYFLAFCLCLAVLGVYIDGNYLIYHIFYHNLSLSDINGSAQVMLLFTFLADSMISSLLLGLLLIGIVKSLVKLWSWAKENC